MNDNGTVLPFQTIRCLTPSEINSPMELGKRQAFDKAIVKRYGDSVSEPKEKPDDVPILDELYADNIENGSDNVMSDSADFDDYEKYINAEVLLPRDGEYMQTAKIVRRAKDQNGNLIGTHHR